MNHSHPPLAAGVVVAVGTQQLLVVIHEDQTGGQGQGYGQEFSVQQHP